MSFSAFRLVELLLALALIVQSVEHLRVWRWSRSVWDWEILREEFGEPVAWFLHPSRFKIVLQAKLLASVALLVYPNILATTVLLAGCLLTNHRWRGTFNGGSDVMTFQILGAVLVAQLFPYSHRAQSFALLYIAVQSVLSYVVAGWVKLLQRSWRDGSALKQFLGLHGISIPISKPRAKFLSWGLMGWELAFPLALLHPVTAAIFLMSGAMFHLLNARLLGLNRFLWIWVATYPALGYFALK